MIFIAWFHGISNSSGIDNINVHFWNLFANFILILLFTIFLFNVFVVTYKVDSSINYFEKYAFQQPHIDNEPSLRYDYF